MAGGVRICVVPIRYMDNSRQVTCLDGLPG